MTNTQDFSHLRALAAEWMDRELDVDDFRCEGGSTSINKLMRAYASAANPSTILTILYKLEAAQAEIERLSGLAGGHANETLRLMTEIERKSDAIQELWKYRDDALARLGELQAEIERLKEEKHESQLHLERACRAKEQALARIAELEKRNHLNQSARSTVDNLLAQAGYAEDSSARNLLGCMNFDAAAGASPVQPSREDADHQAFIDALTDPEEKMFQQVDAWARKSYKHHKSSVRGQQITAADSFDSHLVWATLRWAKENVQPSQAGELSDAERYRFLKTCRGMEHDPLLTVVHEMDGVLWGADLDDAVDEAINAKESK